MKFVIALLIAVFATVTVAGQTPTLRIETEIPGLPSQLFYGNIKIKPKRIRPGTNPPVIITIDDADFFVQDQYLKFLFRFPDQGGFNFWLGGITICGTEPNCIRVKRVDTSAAFFLSIEFKESGYLVERTYKVAYGDAIGTSRLNESPGNSHTLPVPVVRRNEFVPDLRAIGQDVVVGTPGWPERLEANKVAYFLAFVQRARFLTLYPTSLTPTAFVDALNANSGGALDASERATAIGLFGSATDTSNNTARAQAVRKIAEDLTLEASEFNRAWVLMQYIGYLTRDPNATPDTDYTGYEFWLNKLNQFNGDFRAAEMVKAFIESIEYRDSF